MTRRLRWCVEMETRCRIPIWRMFGRIQRHVIPEPRITLQGAATWWVHCHDSRATCHTVGWKNSIRHIENRFSPYFILFLFLMQFRLWRAAANVSSPIHLWIIATRIDCCNDGRNGCSNSYADGRCNVIIYILYGIYRVVTGSNY